MRFLVLMTEEDAFARWDDATDAERENMRGRLSAFATSVQERGTLVAGEALQRPENARTLWPSGSGGGRPVTHGPYAETVEQLGGFYLVDLPDLDTALDTARLLPDAWTIEVRPIEPMD